MVALRGRGLKHRHTAYNVQTRLMKVKYVILYHCSPFNQGITQQPTMSINKVITKFLTHPVRTITKHINKYNIGMYFAYAQDVNALGEFVVNVANLLVYSSGLNASSIKSKFFFFKSNQIY